MSFSLQRQSTKTETWQHTSGFSFGRTVGDSISIGVEVEVGS